MFKKDHLIGLILSFFVFGLLTLIFTQTILLEGLERGAIDLRFNLRDTTQRSNEIGKGIVHYKQNSRARKDIAILAIDEATLTQFSNEKAKLNQKFKWPMEWSKYVELNKYIGRANPTAVLYDIMFLDHKEHENELAESIKEIGSVYLDYPLEVKRKEKHYFDREERIKLFKKSSFKVKSNKTPIVWTTDVTPPTPKLMKAAAGIGFANVLPPRDSVIRKMPLVAKYENRYYPNIDLSIAMKYYGIKTEDVEIILGKHIILKNVPIEKMKKPNKERKVYIPIDNDGFMDINFAGGHGSFQSKSFYLFCRPNDTRPNRWLDNKILLIAAYALTGVAEDTKDSPYGKLFGIEHHANAINTILEQDFLTKYTDIQNILIMLILALILGLVIPRMSILYSGISIFLMLILYSVGAVILFNYSILTAFATPLTQISLFFTLHITYKVMTEQKEKKYVRQTFSKFVSKSVVDELLQNPDKLKLGGDKKILTVLFSDIRGFTSISEKLSPEQLVEHLNVYLQKMTDIVFKYDGTLDKYVGDEIMAFWGAPIPQDNHALLTCKAALEMMEELDNLNENWRIEGKPELDIGIGLNSGDMIVGNMGSASRMDYTLMGDNVNLGARLEGTNKIYKTHVIISEYTYEHVRENVVVRELDLIRVKGKELPVRIYELIDIED